MLKRTVKSTMKTLGGRREATSTECILGGYVVTRQQDRLTFTETKNTNRFQRNRFSIKLSNNVIEILLDGISEFVRTTSPNTCITNFDTSHVITTTGGTFEYLSKTTNRSDGLANYQRDASETDLEYTLRVEQLASGHLIRVEMFNDKGVVYRNAIVLNNDCDCTANLEKLKAELNSIKWAFN